jgi:Tfp pilus assembly protein PilE
MKRIGLKNFRRFARQLGQGMTEYIIVLALIGIISAVIYSFYGNVMRSQTAAASKALSGEDAEMSVRAARNHANTAGIEASFGGNMEIFAGNIK